MKKFLSVLAIGAFAGFLALPRPAEAGVRFGLKAGANMAKPTGADAQDPLAALKNKVGFQGGLFLALDFGRVVAVQWEVLYTMKGASYTALDDSYTDKLYADYVEVPLLLKLRIPMPGIQPFVFAGPSVGFKLREKWEQNGVPMTEKLLKNNDYGAIFGAGLEFGRSLALDVRYSLGLQKVVSTVEGETAPDFKNGVWSASIGIAF
ncbi:MAG: porin family protein [Acidobacteriota bacterium]